MSKISIKFCVLFATLSFLLQCPGLLPCNADALNPPVLLDQQKDVTTSDGKVDAPVAPLIEQSVSIDADLRPIADTIKISDRLRRLQSLKYQLKGMPTVNSLDRLSIRQDVSEEKEAIVRSILKANLEVDYLIARIDGETNQYSQLLQELTGKRDKDVMITSILAQLTNGALWALSCSYTVASTHHASYSYPDGAVGIAAGIVPSVLSLYALYQLQGPKRNLQAEPNVLNPIFGNAANKYVDYPAVVKTYLDEHPTGHSVGATRRQHLIQVWTEKSYLPRVEPSKGVFIEKEQILSGTITKKAALTIKLLQTRLLMLSDLRCEITQMKTQLLGLTELTD